MTDGYGSGLGLAGAATVINLLVYGLFAVGSVVLAVIDARTKTSPIASSSRSTGLASAVSG